MSKQTFHTFTVTCNDHNWKADFKVAKPSTLDDPTWKKLVTSESVKNEQAFANVIIKMAAMLRTYKSAEVAQAALNEGLCVVGGKAQIPTILKGFDEKQQAEIRKSNPEVFFIFN